MKLVRITFNRFWLLRRRDLYPFLSSFQFVFACLVAAAVAGAPSAASYVAAPLPYAGYQYAAYPAGAYPTAYAAAAYPGAAYPLAYENKRVEISNYQSPLTYTAKYTPPTVYSPLGYNQYYAYGNQYVHVWKAWSLANR